MNRLEEKELEQVQAGGVSWGLFAGIAAAITFVVGIIDGYTNPTKCNN